MRNPLTAQQNQALVTFLRESVVLAIHCLERTQPTGLDQLAFWESRGAVIDAFGCDLPLSHNEKDAADWQWLNDEVDFGAEVLRGLDKP